MSNHSPSFARTILPRYHLPSSPILGEVAVRPEGYIKCSNRFLFPAITDVTQIYSEGGVKKVRVFDAKRELRTFSRQAS